jgi:hypothetical protein
LFDLISVTHKLALGHGGAMKIAIALVLCLVISLIFAIPISAQTTQDDVVYLKNGGIIRGLIIEQIPGETIKIQTKDRSIFVYKFNEIEKITKEQPLKISRQSSYTGAQKNPTTAFVLSFLIPGAGQVYNEQVTKGVIQFLGSAAGYTAYILARPHKAEVWVYDYNNYYSYGYWEEQDVGTAAVAWPGIILGMGCHVWSMIDALTTARKLNEASGHSSIDIPFNKNLALSISPTDFPNSSLGPNLKLSCKF